MMSDDSKMVFLLCQFPSLVGSLYNQRKLLPNKPKTGIMMKYTKIITRSLIRTKHEGQKLSNL